MLYKYTLYNLYGIHFFGILLDFLVEAEYLLTFIAPYTLSDLYANHNDAFSTNATLELTQLRWMC